MLLEYMEDELRMGQGEDLIPSSLCRRICLDGARLQRLKSQNVRGEQRRASGIETYG